LIAFKNNNKWGFVNEEGKIVIEPQYDNAKSFSYGLAAVFSEQVTLAFSSNLLL